MSELILADLHKRFGDQPVLTGLDLTVASGSFTALLGRSGAGKTTLLRLLAGFDAPDRGTISVAGTLVAGPSVQIAPERRRIGFVPQEGSLFPHLNVAGNVGFGLPRRRRRARVADLLELVGLAGLERRFPHQLSGGQQQRVALARALAVEPAVVLLDEPFAALDENLRDGLRREVKRILAEAGTTTLLVTHNQDEALSTADVVAVLRDGAIAQQGAPHELYAQPVDGPLASFIGAANLFDGVYERSAGAAGFVVTPLGRLPARWGDPRPGDPGPVTVLIRPEQIAVAAPSHGGGPVGRILSRGYHGHDTVLDVEVADGRGTRPLLVRALGNPPVGPGDSCTLTASGPALVWTRGSESVDPEA